jgi:hypothetical protein
MYQMRISTYQFSLVMLRSKKLEIRKKKSEKSERVNKNKTESRKIESNPSNDRTKHEGDNPSFIHVDEFIKFTFYFPWQFNSSKMKGGGWGLTSPPISTFQVLSYWAVETLGDLQCTSNLKNIFFNQTDILDTINHEEEVDSTDSHVCDALKAALAFTCQTGRRLHLWKSLSGKNICFQHTKYDTNPCTHLPASWESIIIAA